MQRQNINDLMVFLVIARERSFTTAAAKLGVSQSALSHTIRQLEARLGVRLLTRTTRSVSATEAGEWMLQSLGPLYDEIGSAIDGLSTLRDTPAGTVRLTAGDYQIQCYIWPKLRTFLNRYPDIRLELDVNYGLQDIVSDGYDAGVRFGEQIAKDMISVRIGPDVRFAVVAAESYFASRDIPEHPKDLTQHRCINRASQPMADSMPGNSKRMAVRSRLEWTDNSSSTRSIMFLRRLSTVLVSHTSRRISPSPISRPGACTGFSRTIRPIGRASTSIIQAAVNPLRLFPFS